MKKFLPIVILIVVIIVINAAVKIIKTNNSENISDIEYKIHTSDDEGTSKYSKRGYYVDKYKTPDSPCFFIISMGEQNTIFN